MKTTILIIIYTAIIALCENQAFSQIENHGKIDLGCKNGLEQYFYDSNRVAQFEFPANCFYADIYFDLKYKFVKFEQSIKNNFYYKDGYTLNPLDIEFISTISFSCKKISIGYQHSCLHPVISEKKDLEFGYRRGSEDRIFIKFEW